MRPLLIALIVLFLSAGSAEAVSCRDWDRMSDSAKRQTVAIMIQDAVQSSAAGQYRVSPARVARCLEGQINAILNDFDDTCFAGSAGLQALNNIFRSYIWSCV